MTDGKPAALSLLLTLSMLPSWQVAEAADGVRGRHSLIHRPQIQPAPALKPAPSPPQPQLQSAPPSQPVHRKVVRRPVAPTSPLAEVAPVVPTESAQTDSPTASQSYNPNDAPPEAEMAPPPEPQAPPNAEAP